MFPYLISSRKLWGFFQGLISTFSFFYLVMPLSTWLKSNSTLRSLFHAHRSSHKSVGFFDKWNNPSSLNVISSAFFPNFGLFFNSLQYFLLGSYQICARGKATSLLIFLLFIHPLILAPNWNVVFTMRANIYNDNEAFNFSLC